jgi:flagellar biosynthesis chaperone FliJ
MAFRFPLASVLRLRQAMERREELALQKVLYEIAQHRRKIEQLDESIAEADRTREAMLQQPTSAFQLQSMLLEAQTMVENRRLLIDALIPLEQKRLKQMVVYQAAIRERQIMSDLESRRRDEYTVQHERMQQKRLDDIFAARAHRG